ncbi:30201_t:CDS:1, partial [Gigaspora margarita]
MRTLLTTLEEIYQELPVGNPNRWYTKMWLNMNIVYELWCNYTAGRWEKDLSDKNIMVRKAEIRIKAATRILKASLDK